MMKQLQFLILGLLISGLMVVDVFAQQQVTIRDLNTYDFPLESQNDLPDHPMVGVEVTFDAVVISYPKNSGLASITDAGVPGRIHVFVADVNSIDDGLDGNSMQIVVSGPQRETLEALNRGDVVNVTGNLTFFGNVGQFNSTDVQFLGSVSLDPEYEDLAPLLEPTVITMDELNIESDQPGLFQWNTENYTKYIFRYVKVEGAEVINRTEADNGRPWMIAATENSVMTSNDTSLRYRNDRNLYAYDPDTGEGLNYNYRRPDVDGPYVPPANGSVVNWSGFPVVNTFDPGGTDISTTQSTLKMAYFEDGYVWLADGNDPADRVQPEGWPNDLVVLGFAPTIDNFTITPDGMITSGDEVSVSVSVALPEDDYTLESVVIEFEDYAYTEDGGTMVTEEMSASGNTYSYNFGSFDTFTNVNFTIRVTAATPDGVETSATLSDTFFVESATVTSPALFTPAGGDYVNFVEVSLVSPTEGAQIYYTTDGSEPTEDSELYVNPILVDEPTTISAIATSSGNDNSPVNSRTYDVESSIQQFSTLADLRDAPRDGSLYEYSGQAVVTYTRTNRNQKYMQDGSAGILIDDAPGVINDFYAIGDLMSGLRGTLGAFQGTIQFVPSVNPGAPTGTGEVTKPELTLAELDVEVHESMLVEIADVEFVETGEFEGGQNYNLVDASLGDGETITFRTNFGEADYIGLDIPEGVFTLTALVGNFNGDVQLLARFSNDFDTGTNIHDTENPDAFALEQNYPNPFNPTTNIRYSLPESANVTLTVYDVLGRRVATLVNERQTAGQHTVNFDAARLASGTYIYRLETGSFVSVKKMMLIK